MDKDLCELLESEAARINNPDFIADDPVQFPRRFESLPDIEIAALLSSTIAWGNRKMICRNCERMLGLMDWQPHRYVMDEGYEELPPQNLHRTFFAENLQHYLRGLRAIYAKYPSLHDYVAANGIGDTEAPAWTLAQHINAAIANANNGVADSRCLPQNLDATALKRLNMALRWLVRNDGIVDIGVWTAIKPAQLFIPLDVHVGNVSRQLGLLKRASNDRRAVEQLTDTLRTLRPDDPVLYDYALFGIGVTAKNKQ